MDEKNSFVFYRSFLDALKELEAQDFKDAVIALAEYGLDQKEPECTGVVKAIFSLCRPILDTNYQKWVKSKSGGRPKKSETIEKPSDNHDETIKKPLDNHTQTMSKPIDVDVYVDEDVDVKKKKRARTQSDKLVFGEYKHVRLTIEQYDKLAADYGESTRDACIKRLDEYIQERPDYKSKDHNLCIRRWVVDAVTKNSKPTMTAKTTFHNFDMKHDYDYDAIEQELLRR